MLVDCTKKRQQLLCAETGYVKGKPVTTAEKRKGARSVLL